MQTVESYRVEAYVSWSRNRNSVEYVYVYSAVTINNDFIKSRQYYRWSLPRPSIALNSRCR